MNSNRVNLNLGGGKLYQLANRSQVQMMSYLLESEDGRIIMIDSGHYCNEDADFLEEFILKKGGHVSAWFINHAHEDHYGALSMLLSRDKLNIQIDKLYFDFPPTEWLTRVEPSSKEFLPDFLSRLEKHGIKPTPIHQGDVIDCGIKIEILNSLGDYYDYPTINDTTIVMKAHYPKKSVLFLGDLGVAGQAAVIRAAGDKLRCDIVQMAHHGQAGVDFEMYKLIKPEICLYTAPDWLWNNDIGKGYGSGPWRTLETRAWAEQLGVKASFPAAFGDYEFD